MDKLEPNQNVEKPKFKWVANPKDIPEIYTNYVHPSWSLFDIRILFGQLKPALGDQDPFIIEEQGAVSFSWAHAKILANSLTRMVKAYESVNGEIQDIVIAPRYEDIPNESK